MGKQGLTAGVLVLLAAGCGGSHHARAQLSHAAFVAAADRICADAATHGSRVARLGALRPPAADADLFAHWLNAERDARTAARWIAERTRPKGASLAPDLALLIAEGKVAGYARRLGAQACAKRTTGRMPP